MIGRLLSWVCVADIKPVGRKFGTRTRSGAGRDIVVEDVKRWLESGRVEWDVFQCETEARLLLDFRKFDRTWVGVPMASEFRRALDVLGVEKLGPDGASLKRQLRALRIK